MKKKILLVLSMVALLVCLFAITVSADTLVSSDSNEYGTLSVVDDVTEPTTIDKNARAVVVVEGKYYTIPSYYLIKDDVNFTWSVNSKVASALGLPTNQNVRNYLARMEVPKNVTTIGEFRFEQTTTLVEVTLPSTLTELGIGVFKACTSLVEVKNLENTQITALRVDEGTTSNRSRGVFIGCTSLKTLSIPKTVTQIYPWSICGCTALESVIIPEDSQLTFIGRYAFEDAKALKSIRLPNSLETIEFGAFNRAYALTKIENFANTKVTKIDYDTFAGAPLTELQLPSGLIEIGKNAFKGHKIVQEKLVIPNTVTTIGGWALAGAYENNVCISNIGKIILSANLTTFGDNYVFENVQFEEIYIPVGIAQIKQGVFNRLTSKGVVFYITGTEAQANTLKTGAGSSNGSFTGATLVDLKTYQDATDKDSKNYIVYGYNLCDAFYAGKHNTEGVVGVNQFKGDKYVTDYICISDCSRNCGVQAETEICGPLFTNKGYSKIADGTMFTYGVVINEENIAKYVATGKTFNYGVIIGAANFDDNGNLVETNAIIDNTGKALIANSIVVDFSKVELENFTIYNVKMQGIETEAQQNLPIYCCAYIIDGTDVFYMGNAVTENAKTISSSAITVIETTTTTPPATGDDNA